MLCHGANSAKQTALLALNMSIGQNLQEPKKNHGLLKIIIVATFIYHMNHHINYYY